MIIYLSNEFTNLHGNRNASEASEGNPLSFSPPALEQYIISVSIYWNRKSAREIETHFVALAPLPITLLEDKRALEWIKKKNRFTKVINKEKEKMLKIDPLALW